MNDVADPLIVFALGLGSGAVFHTVWHRFWIVSAVGTITGTLLWIGGCYLLFVLTAPSEVGPPLVEPVLLTLAIALAGALVAGGAVRVIRPANQRPQTDRPSARG